MNNARALADALGRARARALVRADWFLSPDNRALARLDARVLGDAHARVLASFDAHALEALPPAGVVSPDAITITYSRPEAAQVAAALEHYHRDLEQRIHHLVRTLPPGDDTWALEKDAQDHAHAALIKTRQALGGSH
jgi:hypothetical protein